MSPTTFARLLPGLRWAGAGFVYWFAFMAMLTPGNLMKSGESPDWAWEGVRLTICGLLGASATPALRVLARRSPLTGQPRWRSLATQLAGVLLIAVALIVASCFLAAWIAQGRLAPTLDDIFVQLGANLLLLICCVGLFLAAIQLVDRRRMHATATSERLTFEERGRVTVVDPASVEWIEAQGNYQALHGSHGTRLIRETSARLEARLPSGRFVRIHRGLIVAVDRVRAMAPLANGDAMVELASGKQLRMSRRYRETVRERVSGQRDGAYP